MLLLFYIPMTKECLGYSTPDVCHWYQTAAGLRIAVLNSLQLNLQAVLHSLHRNTSVQASATLTRWLTSAMIAPLVCASRINSLRCLVSLSPMPCGSAGSTHCFRTLPWVFAFFSDWVVLASESFYWEQVAERRDSLGQQVTMSWCRRDLHLFARCCLHPRTSSAIALSLSLDKTKRILLSAKY